MKHNTTSILLAGMAQRGGSVVTQIRYGKEVFSPLIPVGAAQVIGAFEMMEALRYAHFLAPEGLAVISTHRIIPVSVSSGTAKYPDDIEKRLRRVFPHLVLVDAEGIAAQLGNRRVSNAVVLGALSRGLDLPEPAWQAAFETVVKPDFLEINRRAFAAGRNLASE
ncbi:MAG: indolepyruvate oxidoreductase subunit beta [Kiritimatiellia bacterium]